MSKKKAAPKAVALSPEKAKARNQGIQALKKAEVYVAPIAMGMHELRVNMAHGINKTQDKDLALLAPLAEYITELNLARSKVTDAGMQHIAKLEQTRGSRFEQHWHWRRSHQPLGQTKSSKKTKPTPH